MSLENILEYSNCIRKHNIIYLSWNYVFSLNSLIHMHTQNACFSSKIWMNMKPYALYNIIFFRNIV